MADETPFAEYRAVVRARFHLLVNSADISPERLTELAAQTDVAAKVTKPGKALGVFEAAIDDDLLGVERLRDLLRRNGTQSFLRSEHIFSADEVRAAPLAAVRVDRAERGHGGPRHGSRFTLDHACPNCGTGARPVGDVLLRASDVPKGGDVFRTYDGEIFFSDRVRNCLDAANVTGAEWHQLRAAGTGERLPWAQLAAPCALPPIDAETSGGIVREDPCPHCDRDGYFETAQAPLELRYDLDPETLATMTELLSTWEHFGVSRLMQPLRDSAFAQPLFCVQPRVTELLLALRIRALALTPIAIA